MIISNIICTKKKCLNNDKGQCTATQIIYDGLCQSYVTAKSGMRSKAGRLIKWSGRFKEPPKNVIK